jgi:hypothetical protein
VRRGVAEAKEGCPWGGEAMKNRDKTTAEAIDSLESTLLLIAMFAYLFFS